MLLWRGLSDSGVTVARQWLYCGVAVVVLWRDSGVTKLCLWFLFFVVVVSCAFRRTVFR